MQKPWFCCRLRTRVSPPEGKITTKKVHKMVKGPAQLDAEDVVWFS